MKYQNSDYRYTLIYQNGDLAESDSKEALINRARKILTPCTVIDNKYQEIVFENKAQVAINNQ